MPTSRKTGPCLLGFMLVLSSSPAALATDAYWLPSVEVTARASGAEHVQAEGQPLAATALLRRLPGVHIDRDGLQGGVSSVYLRGAEPNYTAVYIDGVKVNDPTNTRGGSYDFSVLPLAGFRGATLLQGPQSALLGADALSGALALESVSGRETQGQRAQWAVGSRGERQLQLQSAPAAPSAFVYLVGLDHADSDAQTEAGSAKATQLRVALDQGPPASGWQARLRYLDAELHAFPEDSGGPTHAQRREQERRAVEQWVASLKRELRWQERYALQAHMGWFRHQETGSSPGVAPGMRDPFGYPPQRSDQSFDRYVFRVGGQWRGERTRAALGLDGEREQGQAEGELIGLGPIAFDRQRDRLGLVAHLGYGPTEALWFEGSARLERPEGEDPEFLPRLRAAYHGADLSISLSWSEGYKLPSFFALDHPLVGNPGLRPEHARGAEVRFSGGFSQQGEWALALFHTRFEDAIDFDAGPPPRLVNRDEVVTRGAQLSTRQALGAELALRLALTYVDTDIRASDEALRHRPAWTGSLGWDWRPGPALRATLDQRYVGSRRDSSIPTGPADLEAFLQTDLALAWQVRPALALRFEVLNLSDTDYEASLGSPGRARSLRLGATVDF